MKTAMQEFIDRLTKDCYRPHVPFDEKVGLQMAISLASRLLEKEKEQMIDFAMQMHKIDCSKTGTDLLFDEAESYYNQTYNQNK